MKDKTKMPCTLSPAYWPSWPTVVWQFTIMGRVRIATPHA